MPVQQCLDCDAFNSTRRRHCRTCGRPITAAPRTRTRRRDGRRKGHWVLLIAGVSVVLGIGFAVAR
jgi:hypothetical protein